MEMPRERKLQRRDRDATETRRSGNDKSTISLASGMIEEEGIMLEILLALPIKSLIRFKCVCKSWYSFISDPQFGRSHLNRCMLQNPNSFHKFLFRVPDLADCRVTRDMKSLDCERSNLEAFGIVDDKLSSPVRLRLPIPPPNYCNFFGTCDGLVCLLHVNTHIHKVIVIWNPTTGAFKEIKPPAAHFHMLGFGYDPAGGDYKILASVRSSLLKKFDNVHVFSLKGDSWREVCQMVNLNCVSFGVYLNGCLHWLPRKFQLGATPSILSFDLSKEKFQRAIPLPDIDINIYSSLVVLGGCICLYSYQLFHNKCYKIVEYGLKSSWTEFEFPEVNRQRCVNYPLCIRADGKVLGVLTRRRSLISEKNDLYLYSLEDNSCQSASFGNMIIGRPCVYVESLVSP